jgi:hypothetical protein
VERFNARINTILKLIMFIINVNLCLSIKKVGIK